MNHGELQQVAPPETLYAEPVNVFVAGFIGSPKINLIAGHIDHSGDGSALRCLDDDHPCDDGRSGSSPLVAGRCRHHRDSPGRHPAVLATRRAPGRAVVSGCVELIEPLGAETHVAVRVGDEIVTCRTPPRSGLEVGSTINLSFDIDAGNHFRRNEWPTPLLADSARSAKAPGAGLDLAPIAVHASQTHQKGSRMNRLTRVMAPAVGAALLATAAACSNSPASSGSGSSGSSGGTVTVLYTNNYVFNSDALATQWWNGIAKQWKTKYPHTKLVLEGTGGTDIDLMNKAAILFRSPSTTPDVIQLPTTYVAQFAGSGYLDPLNSFVQSSLASKFLAHDADRRSEHEHDRRQGVRDQRREQQHRTALQQDNADQGRRQDALEPDQLG